MSELDEIRLRWLNKRYCFRPARPNVLGNDGEIELRPAFAEHRDFAAEDLTRHVSSLANIASGLAGYGVTEPREKILSERRVIRLNKLVDAWMLGIEHEHFDG